MPKKKDFSIIHLAMLIKKILKYVWIALLASSLPIMAQTSEWQIIGDMPYPVSGGQAVVHGSKIYILGGYSDSTQSEIDRIQVYNPVANSWQQVGQMQGRRALFVADAYLDSLIICGGITGDSVNASSIETWGFAGAPVISNQSTAFNRIGATGAVYGSRLFLFGGYLDQTAMPSSLSFIIEYDILSRAITYSNGALFQGNLPYQQLCARHKDAIYLFGGVSPNISNRAYKFDTGTHEYQRIYPSLGEPRAGGQAVNTKDGIIFLIGGFSDTKGALASVETFQVLDFGYVQAARPRLNVARKELMAVYYNQSIYVFGGKDAQNNVIAGIEKLDLQENTGVVKKPNQVTDFRLEGNYPNPFNTNTTLSFRIDKPVSVRLEIFSLSGQHIKTIADGSFAPGSYKLVWDGTDQQQQPVASGIFIGRLATGSASESIKMTLIR